MIFEIPSKLKKEDIPETPFTFHLYDYESLGDNELIGSKIFLLPDFIKQDPQDIWAKFTYAPSKVPIMEGSQVGKDLEDEGWIPNYPLICIPGKFKVISNQANDKQAIMQATMIIQQLMNEFQSVVTFGRICLLVVICERRTERMGRQKNLDGHW